MPSRERAYLTRDDKPTPELVTVIKGRIGGRGRVTIRNQFGFVEVVSGKQLETVGENDPQAVLRYGEDE